MITVRIGKRRIGRGEPCFIIAEAGVNHNGDLRLAKKLVDIAKESGADAVKFQTFKTECVIAEGAAKAKYQRETTGSAESQYEMAKKLELSEADFRELASHARRKRITLLSTPFDRDSVDLLEELGVPAFKIASGEITNFPLIRYVAQKGKPIILSTGMSTLSEVKKAIETLRGEGVTEIIVLHCVSAYPARVEDTNLRAMATLEASFQVPVGISDHSEGVIVPIAAAALGAAVMEKHFTLDKRLPGPDHRASLSPAELYEMVQGIRTVEKSLGDGHKRPVGAEREIRKVARRSVVAKVDIPRGTRITNEMLAIKRPGTGIPPAHLDRIVGTIAKARVQRDEVLTWGKLEGGRVRARANTGAESPEAQRH